MSFHLIFTQYFPLTLRGILLLAVALFCTFFLGRNYYDLVALIIGLSLIIIILLSLSLLLLSKKRIFNLFSNNNHSFFIRSHSEATSQSDISQEILIPKLKIPPFFTLSIVRTFNPEHEKFIEKKELNLRGQFLKESPNNILFDKIIFKNRGNFFQTGFSLILSDNMGLTRLNKFIPATHNFIIKPPTSNIKPIPLLAASSQLGDLEHSILEKTGDLYNMRAYHPGDSLKKVLWKTYARTSELIVKDPEPAIIPEGEIAIFVIALQKDDHVASATLSYLEILAKQNFYFSLSAIGCKGKVVSDPENAKNLLIKNAFLAKEDQGEGLEVFINNLKEKNFSAQKIVIFIDENYLLDKDPKKQSLLNNIIKSSESRDLNLIIAKVPTQSKISTSYNIPNKASPSTLIQKIDHKFSQNYLPSLNFLGLNKQKKPKVTDINLQNIFNKYDLIQVKYANE